MLDTVTLAACETMAAALQALRLPLAASDRRHLKTATIKGGDLTPVYGESLAPVRLQPQLL